MLLQTVFQYDDRPSNCAVHALLSCWVKHEPSVVAPHLAKRLAKLALHFTRANPLHNLRPLRNLASLAVMLVRSATLTPGTVEWSQLVWQVGIELPPLMYMQTVALASLLTALSSDDHYSQSALRELRCALKKVCVIACSMAHAQASRLVWRPQMG